MERPNDLNTYVAIRNDVTENPALTANETSLIATCPRWIEKSGEATTSYVVTVRFDTLVEYYKELLSEVAMIEQYVADHSLNPEDVLGGE